MSNTSIITFFDPRFNSYKDVELPVDIAAQLAPNMSISTIRPKITIENLSDPAKILYYISSYSPSFARSIRCNAINTIKAIRCVNHSDLRTAKSEVDFIIDAIAKNGWDK